MKRKALLLTMLALACLLGGCYEQIQYPAEGALLDYTSAPYGVADAFTTVITINADGSGTIRAQLDEGQTADISQIAPVPFTVIPEYLDLLKQAVYEIRFLQVGPELSNDSGDAAAYHYITLHTLGGDYRAGGLDPDDVGFETLRLAILECVPEEARAAFQAQTE